MAGRGHDPDARRPGPGVARGPRTARRISLPAWRPTAEPSRTMVRHGRPASEIVIEADRFGADLIVVGARGHSAVERLLVGSVSSEVVDQAHCPVLVVRTPRFARVLLATDGSADGDRGGRVPRRPRGSSASRPSRWSVSWIPACRGGRASRPSTARSRPTLTRASCDAAADTRARRREFDRGEPWRRARRRRSVAARRRGRFDHRRRGDRLAGRTSSFSARAVMGCCTARSSGAPAVTSCTTRPCQY